LEELQTTYPDEPWPAIHLGHVRWLTGARDDAEKLYRGAIGIAAGRGRPRAELLARSALCRILRDTGRMEEAADEVERVNGIAERYQDPFLLAKAGILQASLWTALGNLEESYTRLGEIERHVKEDGSYSLTRDYLFALNPIAQQTGRFLEAWLGCRRLAELAAAQGDSKSEAAALYGLAKARLDELSEMPEPGGREEVLELARRSLSTSRVAQRPSQEAYSLWLLGSLGKGEEAVGHLEKCFAVAATATMRSYCRGALARKLAPSDPVAAARAVDEALSLSREAGDVWSQTSAWHDRMRVSWATHPPAQALKDSLPALSAIESLRDLQEGSAQQPGLFSTWAEDYYWLSGKLLEIGDKEQAFGVTERMRSRTLTDAIGLRAAHRQPDFVSLAQVRGALARDEALLSFQIAPWKDLAGDFGGGSWLLVSTRDTTQLYRLPDRSWVRPAVNTFSGMFRARDGSEGDAASRLYAQLMGPALAELPQDIRRLVIVADDFVHRLPFSALRPDARSDPLATRYEIALTPSATLWLHWRKARPAHVVETALVLAAPAAIAPLEELPYARIEGKAVKRHLGRAELLEGEDASESYVKRNAAGPFGLVHFAAHAVTDEVNPDRSRIHLSPGDDKEDGLLQVREITELDLGSRIVVLSTCESASGEILRGEGVMGLARAFFQAGAHTVVASLWPLRDDYGAALFDRFYHHLGTGTSVAAALQAAQLDRMKEGAPAEAWAGVVVLGDGDRIPVPGGKRPSLVPWAFVLGLLAAALLVRRYRKA
jgi:CHAT domain-containing protein/tetratricopeptide (TPR) repeat protein